MIQIFFILSWVLIWINLKISLIFTLMFSFLVFNLDFWVLFSDYFILVVLLQDELSVILLLLPELAWCLSFSLLESSFRRLSGLLVNQRLHDSIASFSSQKFILSYYELVHGWAIVNYFYWFHSSHNITIRYWFCKSRLNLCTWFKVKTTVDG